MKKIIVSIALVSALMNTTITTAQTPVTDALHIFQRIVEFFQRDIPYSAAFTRGIVQEIAALREYSPLEYAELMSYLEDELAEEFEELIGQVNSAEIVYSYNEELNSIYHSSLDEWIKTAVFAEKSYNSASLTQNKYSNLALSFLSTLSAADREAAIVSTTAETTQSLQQLIKILAQNSRAQATQQSQQHKIKQLQEQAKYLPGMVTTEGCPAASIEVMSACAAEKGDADAAILRASLGGGSNGSQVQNQQIINATTNP